MPRLTAHLADALTGREIWADRFDRWFKDFLDIQDEITKEVVSALQVVLTDGEQARVWARGTKDTTAWESVVVATELIHEHHRDGITKARRLAEEACRLDPDFAAAWAAFGWTHWVEGRWGWENREQQFDTAWTHSDRALSIDPHNPDALALRGVCALHLDRFDEALERMEQAMAHAPGHAHIAALTGYVHRYGGDAERTVMCMDRAIRLSPVHPAWYLVVKAAGLWRLDLPVEAIRDRRHLSRDHQPPRPLALFAEIDGPRGALSVFSTHLNWRYEHSHIRQRQVADLARFADGMRPWTFPPIVCGDFNAEPASEEIRMLKGLTACPVEGLVFHDAWACAGGDGPGYTWDNANPYVVAEFEPDRRIDYILAGMPKARGAGQVVECRVTGNEPVDGVWPSDHHALLAELRY